MIMCVLWQINNNVDVSVSYELAISMQSPVARRDDVQEAGVITLKQISDWH